MEIEELKDKDVLAEMLRNLKLGNTLHTVKYQMNNEILDKPMHASTEMVEADIHKSMIQLMAAEILKNNSANIKKKRNLFDTEYGLQMIAVNLDEFKSIVETVIQILTPTQINQIRNGQTKTV